MQVRQPFRRDASCAAFHVCTHSLAQRQEACSFAATIARVVPSAFNSQVDFQVCRHNTVQHPLHNAAASPAMHEHMGCSRTLAVARSCRYVSAPPHAAVSAARQPRCLRSSGSSSKRQRRTTTLLRCDETWSARCRPAETLRLCRGGCRRCGRARCCLGSHQRAAACSAAERQHRCAVHGRPSQPSEPTQPQHAVPRLAVRQVRLLQSAQPLQEKPGLLCPRHWTH